MAKKVVVLIFLIGCLSLFRTVYLLWDAFLPDFTVLVASGQKILEHKNPYINSVFTQNNYLPAFSILMTPFAILGGTMASNLWLLFSVLFFCLSVFTLYKIKKISLTLLLIFISLNLLSFPFKFTLGMGQTNFILIFAITFLIYATINRKSFLSGFLLAVGTIVKLTPLIYIFHFLIEKNVRSLLFFFLSLFIFLSIPVLILGKDINFYYFNKVFLPLIKEPAGSVYYNQSITGFFSRLNIDYVFLNIARVAIFIISLWIICFKKKDALFTIPFLTIVSLLINNFTWSHHLILLLIPYYFLVSEKKYWQYAISYSLTFFNIKNIYLFQDNFLGSLILSHGFFGVFLLWLIFVFLKIKNIE